MRHHPYESWGLGHMSHPDDPRTCCEYPEDHRIHRPRYWREGDPIVFAANGSDS